MSIVYDGMNWTLQRAETINFVTTGKTNFWDFVMYVVFVSLEMFI
jgi:hypothetical protein